MAMINNPFGKDPVEFNDETAADRIGTRIRAIRVEKGLSQSELGVLIGLNADRIQKYENGARKPKLDMLKKIAGALEVSTLALTDPVIKSPIGAMYALFELENQFDFKIEKSNEDEIPSMRLSVDFKNELYQYLEEWFRIYSKTKSELEVVSSDEERNEIISSYHNWEWTFPQGIVDKTEKRLQKARLRKKIKELQEAYDQLDKE